MPGQVSRGEPLWRGVLGLGRKGGDMAAVADLKLALAGMRPVLAAQEYGFGQVAAGVPLPAVFAMVAEDEGVTAIAPVAVLVAAGIDHVPGWARISLLLHSDLSLVGLTAAIATALTQAGISANVVAGYHHDHLFVQWDRREEAMRVLAGLAHD